MDEQQFTQGKKLVDESLMNQGIDENVQQMINQPQADPTGVDDADKEFMKLVMKLIEDGAIDLYRPETLMNKEVYDSLDEANKGKADTNAVPLLGDIRNIKKLYEAGDRESYQIQNLIHRVRLTKERLENECGNVYII
ncbi:hypothetical protein ACFL3C_03735 [Patescibacteria group bacterium]